MRQPLGMNALLATHVRRILTNLPLDLPHHTLPHSTCFVASHSRCVSGPPPSHLGPRLALPPPNAPLQTSSRSNPPAPSLAFHSLRPSQRAQHLPSALLYASLPRSPCRTSQDRYPRRTLPHLDPPCPIRRGQLCITLGNRFGGSARQQCSAAMVGQQCLGSNLTCHHAWLVGAPSSPGALSPFLRWMMLFLKGLTLIEGMWWRECSPW